MDTSGIFSWLTEARAAIAIAVLSAVFSGAQTLYTRRLAKNDTAKMRRKHPALELQRQQDDADGWKITVLMVRNFEPVGVRLLQIRSAKRGGRIIHQSDTTIGDSPYNSERVSPYPEKTAIQLGYSIGPVGSIRQHQGSTPGAAHTIMTYTKHIETVRDLKLEWEWADGQKR